MKKLIVSAFLAIVNMAIVDTTNSKIKGISNGDITTHKLSDLD